MTVITFDPPTKVAPPQPTITFDPPPAKTAPPKRGFSQGVTEGSAGVKGAVQDTKADARRAYASGPDEAQTPLPANASGADKAMDWFSKLGGTKRNPGGERAAAAERVAHTPGRVADAAITGFAHGAAGIKPDDTRGAEAIAGMMVPLAGAALLRGARGVPKIEFEEPTAPVPAKPVKTVKGAPAAPKDAGGLAIPEAPHGAPPKITFEAPRKSAKIRENPRIELHESDAAGTEKEGSYAASGPIVGDEPVPSTRTANALYRLGGHATADKIEVQEFRNSLPKEISDPKVKEELYHAIEEKLTNPAAEIPEHLKPAYEAIKPYLEEQTEIANRRRERNGGEAVVPYENDQGYVHRVKEGAPHLLRDDTESGPRDPFRGRKTLTKTTGADKQRKFFVLEDEKGQRQFAQNPDPDWEAGMQIRGSFGRPFTIKQATTREIETNTDTRYVKDAIDNTLDNVLRQRRADRNEQVLEATLADMKARGVAHQGEWRYKDAEGRWQTATANSQPPAGFHSLPGDKAQLKGWTFDHNDAQVQELKDWLPKPSEDWERGLDRLNNFMLRSNFLSPFVHPKNVAEFWAINRGGDWLSLPGYGRLSKTAPRAVTEVLTMGPAYRRMLREGSGLLSGDSRLKDFHQQLVDKAVTESVGDPKVGAALLKDMGLQAVMKPAELYTKVQEASHKMMWMVSDMMMLQRQLELEAKGLGTRAAIAKAEDTIPNYRVPAQIANSRMLSAMMRNNRIFVLGRYHYNKFKAWGTMFRKIAKGSAEERKEAAGQFVAAALLAAVVITTIDQALKIATGNQNARVKRGGMLGLPDSAVRVSKGEQSLPAALASVIDVSPLAKMGYEGITQKDWKGDPLIDPNRSVAGNAAHGAEWLASGFGPAQEGLEALTGTYGPGRVAANQIGVDLPQQPPGAMKSSTAAYLRRRAKSQDKKDPLMSLGR